VAEPDDPRDAPRVPAWLDTTAQLTWRALVILAGLTALVLLVTRLYLVSLPVVIALILATIAVPPARRLERRGLPRLAAATVVVAGGGGLLVGGVSLLVPAFSRQVGDLGPTVVDAFTRLLEWLEASPLGLDRAQLDGLLEDALGNIARTPARYRDDLRAAGARGWGALAGYVRGTAAIALIDAVGVGIGLLIVGVPLVLPLTVLVFVGGFVPVIGAFTSGLLATLVALATGGLSAALAVLAVVLVVQQVEGNVLQPVIMRRAVALHPVVILGVLTAGTVVVGLAGAFLAVPLAATVAAVGNELRLRGELRRAGTAPGPRPVGGRGIEPELVLPEALPVEPRRSRRRARRGGDDA
jgi:predicted PurR-regulated permease PerM